MSARRVSWTFRDQKQQTSSVRGWISDTPGSLADTAIAQQALGNDMAALSNAVWESSTGPYPKPPAAVVAGAAAVYEEVEDKARFVFATATGAIHRYEVPAPKSSIFLADGVTVDYTNAAVKQFVADMLATTFSGTAPSSGVITPVSSRDDKLLTVSIGALRIRRPFIRRFSIYTRAPSGGQGE